MHSSGIHTFLTSRTFTPFQLQFLSNGLRFICTPPKTQLPIFIQHFLTDNERGWKRFSHTLTQRVLYQHKEQADYIPKFALPHATNAAHLTHLEDELRSEMADELHWLKRYKDQTLQLLSDVVTHDNNAAAVSRASTNYSSHDRRFLKDLLSDATITIKPADKNLGLAFVDTSWYTAELKRMLADTVTYRKIPLENNESSIVTKLKAQLVKQLKTIAKRHETTLTDWHPEHGEKMKKFLSHRVTADKAAKI